MSTQIVLNMVKVSQKSLNIAATRLIFSVAYFVHAYMISAQGTKVVTKTRRSSSPAGVRKNSEAVRMSMFPGGKPPAPKEVAKIEREDWPGPPSPAALLPEISKFRISSAIRRIIFLPKQSQRSRSVLTDLDLWDCLGRVKLVLCQNFIGLIQLFEVSLEGQKPRLIAG